ncbi:electron transport complex subunit RsxD [Marinibactrum halimedae]|uniref:Ion-translocating oxidoreductase complex subunit D n=1 Tax=Marinibactrum halimedae TaxID=1444977 RepID=A0AA37WM34_9GAMM|nr:electron transport complex subunit RsxD [Marinibactrum halimedae]MCD9460357.1 electron transport complex subunit RsxD [Marinibactrum halimedae]GLS26794.1 electron transport complex subunit D [Marinibactrum halimedae]
MALIKQSSPHTRGQTDTTKIMQTVILATIPGILTLTYFFGIGTFINLILASAFCLIIEASVLKVRRRPVGFFLKDYSALVTAVLLGVALPPYCPWWIIFIGSLFAIGIAKQLYGGLGYNPFNPAMVGYVVLLISFPVEMTRWPAPTSILTDSQSLPGLTDALSLVFGFASPVLLDGYTGATPLDAFKQNTGLMADNLYASQAIFREAHFAGAGWEWVNVAFLLGGLFLLYRKVFTWHAPIAMLASLGFCALIFYDGGSNTSGASPLLHWFSGATMLGAFFIITDPVSSAVSNKGRLIYGGCIGIIIYVIRQWGNYPDAVAFAVLLMNFAAPFIDYYTLPRTYGHTQSRRATDKIDTSQRR